MFIHSGFLPTQNSQPTTLLHLCPHSRTCGPGWVARKPDGERESNHLGNTSKVVTSLGWEKNDMEWRFDSSLPKGFLRVDATGPTGTSQIRGAHMSDAIIHHSDPCHHDPHPETRWCLQTLLKGYPLGKSKACKEAPQVPRRATKI